MGNVKSNNVILVTNDDVLSTLETHLLLGSNNRATKIIQEVFLDIFSIVWACEMNQEEHTSIPHDAEHGSN